jgi:signal transduction histidine kinase
MAGITRRHRVGRAGLGSELVSELLTLLGQPRPALALGERLLDLVGAASGYVLARDESNGTREITVLTTRGTAQESGWDAAALAKWQQGSTAAEALAFRTVSFGDSPELSIVAAFHGLDEEAFNAAEAMLPSIEHDLSAACRAARRIERLELSEAALAAAGREKEEFTGFLLHDLRNPLTVALTNLEYLREAGQVPEGESQAALRDTEDSVSLVVDHLGGLLDIAQLEEARMPCHRQPVQVREVVRSVVDQFEFSARRRQVRLTLDCDFSDSVLLDQDLLRRMLNNLLTTSLRVTPAGGWILVQARPERSLFVLVVATSGPPVDEDVRPSLFMKYRRLGAGGRSDTHAHGLGLYFVRLAAEAHGGGVRAETRSDGLAFVVELPQAEPPLVIAS